MGVSRLPCSSYVLLYAISAELTLTLVFQPPIIYVVRMTGYLLCFAYVMANGMAPLSVFPFLLFATADILASTKPGETNNEMGQARDHITSALSRCVYQAFHNLRYLQRCEDPVNQEMPHHRPGGGLYLQTHCLSHRRVLFQNHADGLLLFRWMKLLQSLPVVGLQGLDTTVLLLLALVLERTRSCWIRLLSCCCIICLSHDEVRRLIPYISDSDYAIVCSQTTKVVELVK